MLLISPGQYHILPWPQRWTKPSYGQTAKAMDPMLLSGQPVVLEIRSGLKRGPSGLACCTMPLEPSPEPPKWHRARRREPQRRQEVPQHSTRGDGMHRASMAPWAKRGISSEPSSVLSAAFTNAHKMQDALSRDVVVGESMIFCKLLAFTI